MPSCRTAISPSAQLLRGQRTGQQEGLRKHLLLLLLPLASATGTRPLTATIPIHISGQQNQHLSHCSAAATTAENSRILGKCQKDLERSPLARKVGIKAAQGQVPSSQQNVPPHPSPQATPLCCTTACSHCLHFQFSNSAEKNSAIRQGYGQKGIMTTSFTGSLS